MIKKALKIISIFVILCFILFVLVSFFWPRSEQVSEICYSLPEEVSDMINQSLYNTGLFIDDAHYMKASNSDYYFVVATLYPASESKAELIWISPDIYDGSKYLYLSLSSSAENYSKFNNANVDQIHDAFMDKNYLKARLCLAKNQKNVG